MEKYNKDLENIKMERDSLHETIKETNANYWNLEAKKDILSIERNKFQKDYKNMEQNFFKQQKELKKFIIKVGNVYQANNDI